MILRAHNRNIVFVMIENDVKDDDITFPTYYSRFIIARHLYLIFLYYPIFLYSLEDQSIRVYEPISTNFNSIFRFQMTTPGRK